MSTPAIILNRAGAYGGGVTIFQISQEYSSASRSDRKSWIPLPRNNVQSNSFELQHNISRRVGTGKQTVKPKDCGAPHLAAALYWRATALCSKGLEAANLPIVVASTL